MLRRTDWLFLSLAWPLVLQNALKASFQAVDSVLVARLGTAAMASGGFTNQIMGVFMLMLFATSAAIQPVVSQALQTPARRAAGWKFVWISSFVFLGLGVLLSVIGWWGLSHILEFGKLAPDVWVEARRYLLSLLPMLPLLAMALPLEAALRAERRLKEDLWIRLVGLAVNAGLSILLIHGLYGAPHLGVVGAGLATTVSKLVELVLLIAVAGRLGPGFEFGSLRIPREWLGFVWQSLGVLYMQEICWSVLGVFWMRFFSDLGTEALALWQYVSQLDSWLVWVTSGLFTAGSIQISRELGRGTFRRAEILAFRNLNLIFLMGVCCIPLALVIRPWIEGLYGLDGELREKARVLGLVFALGIPMRMLTMQILLAILRPGGVFRSTALGEIFLCWALALPLMFLVSAQSWANETWLYLMVQLNWTFLMLWFLWLMRQRSWLRSI